MSREIEFRAWDKLNKKWIGKSNLEYLCVCGDIVVLVKYKHDKGIIVPESCRQLTWNETKKLTIMQFTGLLDKNGKKIFEGDIIKHIKYEEIRGDIQFSHGVFGAEWIHNKKFKSMVGGWGQKHNLKKLDDDTLNNFEVIGNVHQNPELLEAEHEDN